ncbi:MAG: hypothetical protein EON60_02600 [Alphaproteobacteria bacterium]|nr:MAG: hypothetical protein EON60_02600 [Alphaproteobacteria bacterium]
MKKLLPALALAATLTACAGTPSAAHQPTTQYVCTGGAIPSIGASYANKSATISIQEEDGHTTYTLKQTPSPNGQRFTNARTSPAAVGRLVWYTNADKAILYVVTQVEEKDYTYEKVIADCALRN